MEELFQYDVPSTSYWFVEDLMMTKLQKSALVQDLETKLTNDDERVPAMDSKLQTACIAGVMANIRKIKTKDIETFVNFCKQFLNYSSALDRFWSSSNNKLKLQMLLHTQAIKHGIETPSTVHVVASCFSGASDGATCKGVMDGEYIS